MRHGQAAETLVPVTKRSVDPVLAPRADGDLLILAVDCFGRLRVVRDDGAIAGGPPIAVDAPPASVLHLLLEPPGLFASPASFLAATSEGPLARHGTTPAAPPATSAALPRTRCAP